MAVRGPGEALGAIKRVFENLNPDPAPPLVGIWTYPREYTDIDLSIMPVAILSEVVNIPNQWLRDANDLSESRWAIEALVFVQFGPLTSEPQASEAEKLHSPWPGALAETLSRYQNLYRTVVQIGTPGDKNLFNWQVGQIDFWAKVYWGIRFMIPVSQSHSH